MPVSIDTTQPLVAKIVLEQGADLINDVSGYCNFTMLNLIKKFKACYCFMHNSKIKSKKFLSEFLNNVESNVNSILKFNIEQNKIIIDPGFGFNKNVNENLILLKNLKILKKFKLPILIGTSNKSFIGHVLNEPNLNSRLFGTIATSAIGAFLGANFIRVHNVKQNFDAIKIVNAIKNLKL